MASGKRLSTVSKLKTLVVTLNQATTVRPQRKRGKLNEERVFVAVLGVSDYRRISKFRGINERLGSKSTPRNHHLLTPKWQRSQVCCHRTRTTARVEGRFRVARQRLMKSKTWKVITNTGKQADLESGLEKKKVQKPTHISAREFVHWLAPESRIDDNSLQSLFKQ